MERGIGTPATILPFNFEYPLNIDFLTSGGNKVIQPGISLVSKTIRVPLESALGVRRGGFGRHIPVKFVDSSTGPSSARSSSSSFGKVVLGFSSVHEARALIDVLVNI